MTFGYATRPIGPGKLGHGARTVIFVPRLHYPTGYAVQVEGARVVSRSTAPWVELVAAPGAREVAVTITPRTGSSTELPSEAGAR